LKSPEGFENAERRQRRMAERLLETEIKEFARLFTEYGCVEVFNHDGYRTLTTYPFNSALVTNISSFANLSETE
jgi:hypothetical protein